jgi:lysophospholipase L1-like esterase
MWAWVVMAIGVAAIVVLFPLALNRGVVDDPGRTSSATTSRATPTPMTTAPPPPLQVLVIGDELAAGAAEAGNETTGWPLIVEGELRADGYDVTVDVSAGDGSGYTEPGEAGATFGEWVETAPPGNDLVVFVGGASDEAGLQAVQEAAYEAYLAVWAVDGDAYMLAVGPVTSDAEPPPAVRTTQQGVLAATQRAGIPFVDPFREAWFAGDEEFFAEDRRHLTDAGQQRMAERLVPLGKEQIRQILRDPSVTLDD